MLKNFRIIKAASSEISSAAEEAANAVLSDYSKLEGREEEITAQLRGEINRRLLKNIENRLGNTQIDGCRFSVATFKKKQESTVGADFAGVLEISSGDRTISKAFLAQAKVGTSYGGKGGKDFVRSNNRDILQQAESMLRLSSDSFFFLYSDIGIHCISALQVELAHSNTIDTAEHPFHTFGAFYEEHFKCFIGDHLISPSALCAATLEDYAEKVKATAVMKISVELGSDN